MLKGSAKLDVPDYSDSQKAIEQGMDPLIRGIEIGPEDLAQDSNDPSIYRGRVSDPPVEIKVVVRPDGSTAIETIPHSEVFGPGGTLGNRCAASM